MTRLVLSTSNIVHAGPSIIRRHPAERSSVELIASLRANIVAAQEDAQLTDSRPPSHDDQTSSEPDGLSKRPPPQTWTSREDSTIYVPAIDWSLSGLAEERSQYDITVKLFFLPDVSPSLRCMQTKDAIDLVVKELGVPSIDLLILSFPGVVFNSDEEQENSGGGSTIKGNRAPHDAAAAAAAAAATVEDMATMVKTWRTAEKLHAQGIVGRLGVAEFNSRRMEEFLRHTKVRPSVNQINVRDCCTVPRSLVSFAKREQIELLAHNDWPNILPPGASRELLDDGKGGVGVVCSEGPTEPDVLAGRIEPQWVVKYTAVVRDRGVVENKGYFAVVSLDEDGA